MDRLYGSWDHGWLSVHGGLVTMGRRGGEDGLMIALNRGDRWCSDGEMVLRARRRDWSRGACGR
jgi:hypothetical protein